MEIRVIDEVEARAGLNRGAVVAALRRAFAGLVDGSSVQPTQTVTAFPGGGDAIFYPGVVGDVVGVKVSPRIPGRPGRPVTAYTLLLSTTTGEPLLLCDSYALTTARTAATTALAVDCLAPAAASRLAIVGAGAVALEHLRYVAPLREWASVTVFSPSLSAGETKRAGWEGVELAATVRGGAEGADVVMLCTSSGTPVLDTTNLQRDVVVTSISTNVPRAHEIEPNALNDFAVYCDYRRTAPTTAGEMVLAIAAGQWSAAEIRGDLPELVTGQVERPAGGRVFFRSTGLGLEDLAIAGQLI